MDIQDTPRDLPALLALPRYMRYRLFLELREDTDKVSEEQFLNQSDEEQSKQLLEMLQEQDEGMEPGYCVLSAALPKRSKDKKTNEKRMAKFAHKVENILNSMQDTHETVRMISFENHGILVVGHQPPKREPVGMPFPFASILPMGMIGPPPEQESKGECKNRFLAEEAGDDTHLSDEDRHELVAICNQAFTMVSLTDDETVLDKNLDEFVDNALGGMCAEKTKSFLKELNRLEDEHAIVHNHERDDGCQLGRMFEKLRARLEKRVYLTTN